MLLAEIARVSQEVAATSARSEKTGLLAGLFRTAGPEEAAVTITYLAGRLPQGRVGIGWSVLREAPAPAAAPTLTVADVDRAVDRIAAVTGKGAQAERRRLVDELMGAATAGEQRFLRALLGGELRQGALDALTVEGLAAAAGAD
ncbi:ATP-dependent DNA ligase, partial [Streptomyces sp. ISL-11]|nr:ATP-dependent DNA ligase [Streptomyces sp. ISL-11]